MAKRLSSTKSPRSREPLLAVGWREWVRLPQLGVIAVKAKVDTGAQTSTLHAFDLVRFQRRGAPWARFVVHPLQRQSKPEVVCEAEIIDDRRVRSSSGHVTKRAVIRTLLAIGESAWPIELTLASRDEMGFRMLLGRQALRKRCLVDPGRSFIMGKNPNAPARRAKKKKKKTKRSIRRRS